MTHRFSTEEEKTRNAFEPLNFPRLPRPDELQRRPELASVVSLITLLEIVRRAWRASPHRNHLWNNTSAELNDSERRIRGLELRAFYLLVELEDFLSDSYNEMADEYSPR